MHWLSVFRGSMVSAEPKLLEPEQVTSNTVAMSSKAAMRILGAPLSQAQGWCIPFKRTTRLSSWRYRLERGLSSSPDGGRSVGRSSVCCLCQLDMIPL